MKRCLLIYVLFLVSVIVYGFAGGITGVTRKNGTGCTCHGTSPSSEVRVSIIGPDTISVNDTVNFFVKLSGGPLIRGGTNIAVRNGKLIPGTGLRKLNDELTHQSPFIPNNDTITFSFRYAASNIATGDTIYANGNSVNFDGFSVGDKWNFASNKRLTIISSTSIRFQKEKTLNFQLYQNYPNPFNPKTTIEYSIYSPGMVKLKIFDPSGKLIATPVNEYKNKGNYKIAFDTNSIDGISSGVLFYTLSINNYSETKRMLLIK